MHRLDKVEVSCTDRLQSVCNSEVQGSQPCAGTACNTAHISDLCLQESYIGVAVASVLLALVGAAALFGFAQYRNFLHIPSN